jgi:hypothetical protein
MWKVLRLVASTSLAFLWLYAVCCRYEGIHQAPNIPFFQLEKSYRTLNEIKVSCAKIPRIVLMIQLIVNIRIELLVIGGILPNKG